MCFPKFYIKYVELIHFIKIYDAGWQFTVYGDVISEVPLS